MGCVRALAIMKTVAVDTCVSVYVRCITKHKQATLRSAPTGFGRAGEIRSMNPHPPPRPPRAGWEPALPVKDQHHKILSEEGTASL